MSRHLITAICISTSPTYYVIIDLSNLDVLKKIKSLDYLNESGMTQEMGTYKFTTTWIQTRFQRLVNIQQWRWEFCACSAFWRSLMVSNDLLELTANKLHPITSRFVFNSQIIKNNLLNLKIKKIDFLLFSVIYHIRLNELI